MAVIAISRAALLLVLGVSPIPFKSAVLQTSVAGSDKLDVLEVRPSFFLIATASANIGVQVGEDGIVVVDTGSSAEASSVLAAIRRISPKPIRYIIDTGPDSDHVGGNEVLARAGERFFSGGSSGGGGGGRARDDVFTTPIVAVEGALKFLESLPPIAVPNETFFYPRKVMYLNGEPIEVLSQPNAHTDSDAVVFFRRSDVVVAGDVLDTRQFPVIDVARGGSIQGEIAALDRLVELAVPSTPVATREAGTIVVPGHGRLCDQYDVLDYRDMVIIIRDRVRELMKAGRSLAEIKAAQPAIGYVGRYGKLGGASTTDRFIEAIYQGLSKEKQ
jgi:glyoxylase-like metal-dependent hydrolase (beta-lactamase superfamily II)